MVEVLLGVAGEWMKQRVNAGVPMDIVTGADEWLTPRANLGDRWGSQVLYTVSTVAESGRKQLRR